VMFALSVLRRYAPLSILVAFSLYHGFALVRSSTLGYLKAVRPDPVSALERRLAPLKTGLASSGYNTVGYVTDIPIPEDPSWENPVVLSWAQQYLRAQYVLAPIMLDDSPAHSVVVAIFRNASSREGIVSDLGFPAVVDYGNGVFLLLRSDQ
jgi:hypothetical protein